MENNPEKVVREAKVNKKSKFNQFFDQPLRFDENSEWVLSAELYTKEEAYQLFREEIDGWGQHEEDNGSRWQPFTIENITEDRVRYCCQGYDETYYNNKPVPLCAWWLGQTGKGSKPVWVLQVYMRPRHLKDQTSNLATLL